MKIEFTIFTKKLKVRLSIHYLLIKSKLLIKYFFKWTLIWQFTLSMFYINNKIYNLYHEQEHNSTWTIHNLNDVSRHPI